MTTSRKILLPILIVVLVLALVGVFVVSFAYTGSTPVAQAAEETREHTPEVSTHDHSTGWNELNSGNIGTSLSSGNYMLTENVVVPSTITIAEGQTVTLCLNGYIMEFSVASGFVINGTGKLVIEDCNSTNSTHRFYRSGDDYSAGLQGTADMRYVIEGTSLWDEEAYSQALVTGTITGGILTSSNAEIYEGTFLKVSAGTGRFVFNSGSVSGITVYQLFDATSGGIAINGGMIVGNQYAGVFLYSRTAMGATGNEEDIVKMTGGSIIYNLGKVWGGAKSSAMGVFSMSGGDISYNYALNGALIRINSYSAAFITGGTVTNNCVAFNYAEFDPEGWVRPYYVEGAIHFQSHIIENAEVRLENVDCRDNRGCEATTMEEVPYYGADFSIQGDMSSGGTLPEGFYDLTKPIFEGKSVYWGVADYVLEDVELNMNVTFSGNTTFNNVTFNGEMAFGDGQSGSNVNLYTFNGGEYKGTFTMVVGTLVINDGYFDGNFVNGGYYECRNQIKSGYFTSYGVASVVDTSAGYGVYYVGERFSNQFRRGYPYAVFENSSEFVSGQWIPYINQMVTDHSNVTHDGWLALTEELLTVSEGQLINAPFYLASDVTVSDYFIISSGYTAIDLNGHTLTGKEMPNYFDTGVQCAAGELTILDCTGEGKIVNGITYDNDSRSMDITIKLLGGTIDKTPVYQNGASGRQYIIVDGATVETYELNGTVSGDITSGTIKQLNILHQKGSFTVNGGQVDNVNNTAGGSVVFNGELVESIITSTGSITIADNATLNVIGGDIGGTVSTQANSVVNLYNGAMSALVTKGTLNLYGGEYSAQLNIINGLTVNVQSGYLVSSTVNVTGGTLNVEGGVVSNLALNSGTANLHSGGIAEISALQSTLNIYGGDLAMTTLNVGNGGHVNVYEGAAEDIFHGLSLASGAKLTIDSKATIKLDAPTLTDASCVVVNGNLTVTNIDISDKLTGTGTVTLGTGATLTVADGDTVDYSVVVAEGTMAMTAGNFGGTLTKAQDATGTISLTGGNFKRPLDASLLGEESMFVLLEDGEPNYNANYPYVIYTYDADGAVNSIIVTWGTLQYTYDGLAIDQKAGFQQTITDGEQQAITQKYTVEYTYVVDGVTYYGLPKDAGTYDITVTLYFKDTVLGTAYTAVGAVSGVTIDQRQVTVTWGKETQFVYDGQAHAPIAQVGVGVIYGDDLGLTVTSATDAGTHKAVATASNTNYTITNPECEYTISKKQVAVVWGDKVSFEYNGQAQAPTATADSGIEGIEVGVTVAGNVNAGDYTATATASNGNFELTNTTRDYTITKKQVAVVWGETALTYNGQALVPTATVDTGVAGETLTVTVTGAQTANGTYYAAASIDNPNYELTNYGVQFTIAGGPQGGGMSGLATAMLIITIVCVLGAGGLVGFMFIKRKKG